MSKCGNKKKIFYSVVLILTFVIMAVSTTIAYFSFIDSQKKDKTHLYTGTLSINYIDGVYINNPNLYPLDNVDFNTKEHVYRNNFEIKSSGTLDQKIKIDLVVSKNDFKFEQLKYKLYNDNGLELTYGYIPKDGSVILTENMFLGHDETAKYTLIIWLDNKDYNQNSEMGKKIVGRIDVNASQIKY